MRRRPPDQGKGARGGKASAARVVESAFPTRRRPASHLPLQLPRADAARLLASGSFRDGRDSLRAAWCKAEAERPPLPRPARREPAGGTWHWGCPLSAAFRARRSSACARRSQRCRRSPSPPSLAVPTPACSCAHEPLLLLLPSLHSPRRDARVLGRTAGSSDAARPRNSPARPEGQPAAGSPARARLAPHTSRLTGATASAGALVRSAVVPVRRRPDLLSTGGARVSSVSFTAVRATTTALGLAAPRPPSSSSSSPLLQPRLQLDLAAATVAHTRLPPALPATMESPCPPQLSSLPAPAPTSPAGPSPSSSPSSASTTPQPAPVASTSAASAEPRQQQQRPQQRKRAFTAAEAAEVECGGAGEDRGLAAPGEAVAGRRMSVPHAVRIDGALASSVRDQGAASGWHTASGSEARGGRRASLRSGEDADRPLEKRRRIEHGAERAHDAPEPAYQTAPPSRRRRPRLSHSSSLRSSRSAGSVAYLASASLPPSPYLGVFATPFAVAAVAPEPSSTQPPAPSPRLAPASARLAQGAFPTSTPSYESPSLRDAPRPRRRRANSLPNLGHHAVLPSSPRPAPSSPSAPVARAHRSTPTSPSRRCGSTSGLVEESRRQRRSPGPSVGDALVFGSYAVLSQDDLLGLHAAHVRAEGGDVTRGSLSAIGLAPPVTKTTLRELDLHEILRNPQLRHDVVFDPNLMFRPNYDGERGERKRLSAAQYWTAVAREIDTGCRCTTFCGGVVRPCICLPSDTTSHGLPLATRLPSRIALLIAELRNIFVSLLPTSTTSAPASPDLSTSSPTFANLPPSSPNPSSPSPPPPNPVLAARDQLLDVLDPALLMQQLERGCADVPSLARFLGATVKQHCAPMRDEMVDAMVVACEGEGLAKGLEMCFEILELMKLDIANHQLRSLRPYLVQTAVDFERRVYQDFAARRRGPGAFDRIRTWLHSSAAGLDKKDAPRALANGELVEQALTQGLLDLVFPADGAASASSATALPETLQLDSYRTQAFHSDAVDLSVVHLLTMLCGQLAYPARPTPADLDSLRQELWCLMASSARSPSALAGPAASIQGIPQGPPGLGTAKLESPRWRAGMQDVLLQVARRATELRQRASSSSATTSGASSTVPDAETLALVASYFDSNVRASSKLFQLLQRRLRETLHAVVDEELAKEAAHGPMSFTGWWAPQVEPGPMATGGARTSGALADFAGSARASSGGGARPTASMMASAAPVRGVKRSHLEGDDACDSTSSSGGTDRRQRHRCSSSSSSIEAGAQLSPVDLALQRNGLVALSTEVKLLGMRIARVATFNLAVYRPLYSAWLSIPPPSSSSSSQA